MKSLITADWVALSNRNHRFRHRAIRLEPATRPLWAGRVTRKPHCLLSSPVAFEHDHPRLFTPYQWSIGGWLFGRRSHNVWAWLVDAAGQGCIVNSVAIKHPSLFPLPLG